MANLLNRSGFGLLILLSILGVALIERANAQDYPWTILIPDNDSRDEETKIWDEFDTQSMIQGMNEVEDVFHHHLVWNEVRIRDLFSVRTPFCELRFDAVKPLILTDDEKAIIREYFQRGGFILFQEDAYPYEQDEFWAVKSWPVIDYLTKELPAMDPDFKVEKITDAHELFHTYYSTETAEFTKHELRDNPYTPNRTLVKYKGQSCAFVYGRYFVMEGDKWVAMPRPFQHIFSLDPRGYALTVNIYVHAALH